MPLIELETRIAAPIGRVFDLARSIDAHQASTEGSQERAVAGRTSGLIAAGETVTWEAKHFGVRQRLSVKVTAMERPNLFADEMLQGAFAVMQHTHRFTEADGETVMRDEFFFRAPLGFLGRIAEALFLMGYMKSFLQKRALALKDLAESDDWRKYLQGSSNSSDW